MKLGLREESCTEIAWRGMNECLDDADWCVALLRGRFGEDESMLYRKNPRYAEFKPFPQDFLDVSKSK